MSAALGIHHVELWVADLERGFASWGWLLTSLGWTVHQQWPEGRSWTSGGAYVVVTRPPTLADGGHNRRLPGLNHLALHVASTSELDRMVDSAPEHGWLPLYADRYPHAGGPDHYAAYLENADGFKAELVARMAD